MIWVYSLSQNNADGWHKKEIIDILKANGTIEESLKKLNYVHLEKFEFPLWLIV